VLFSFLGLGVLLGWGRGGRGEGVFFVRWRFGFVVFWGWWFWWVGGGGVCWLLCGGG